MKKILAILISLTILLTACGPKDESSKYSQEDLDNLAQCLTENDVVMYGVFWCPHCINSKKKFGSAVGYLNYVECDSKCKPDENGKLLLACKGHEGQPELCLERDIKGYDTWIFGDGTRTTGEPALELLDQKSECNILPKIE